MTLREIIIDRLSDGEYARDSTDYYQRQQYPGGYRYWVKRLDDADLLYEYDLYRYYLERK